MAVFPDDSVVYDHLLITQLLSNGCTEVHPIIRAILYIISAITPARRMEKSA